MGTDDRARSWGRRLEGWQLAVIAVGLAACSAWLGLPRPVEPEVFPLPTPDRRLLLGQSRLDAERAQKAQSRRLPYEVRALGEFVRRQGAALARRDLDAVRVAASDAAHWAPELVRRFGAEPLEELRALQTELFVRAVHRWQQSGRVEAELEELGGDFPEKCRQAHWIDSRGRLALSESELSVLFKVRWASLAGLQDLRQLRPKLDEFRSYYRTLLAHPEGSNLRDQEQQRLAYVAALSRIDGDYPAQFARGVLLYRLDQPSAALAAFTAHLSAHPDGAWALRARNHALMVLARANAAE